MRRVLWWLIGGSRGGRNRLRIVRAVQARPANANQLAARLDLDYKTVQHHLDLLVENDVLTTEGDGYGKLYFLSDRMTANMDVLETVIEEANIDLSETHDE